MFIQFTTLLASSTVFEVTDCLFTLLGGSGMINRQAKFSPWLVAGHCFYIFVNVPLVIVFRAGFRAGFMGSFAVLYLVAFTTRRVEVSMVLPV